MFTPNLSRRQFSQHVVASAALGSVFVHTQDKTETSTVIGIGEYKYEVVHDWGRSSLPATHEYGWTSNGVAIDSQRRLYVTHHGTHGSVYVFDSQGKFIRAMADRHRSTKEAAGHGIDIRSENGEEYIYLSPDDGKMAFTKMTLGGEVVWQKNKAAIEKDSELKLKRFRPTNCSFRPDGGYYLGDGYGSSFVFEYNSKNEFVRALGGPGTADGKFRTPHGQWLDDRDGVPKLVVVDRANKRLQWFDMDGNHLKSVGGFVKPAAMDVQGDLIAVADIGTSITLLNKSDRVVAKLGHDAEWEKQVMDRKKNVRGQRPSWKPGLFVHPHDVCFDPDGNLFVSEYVLGGRVTKLKKLL